MLLFWITAAVVAALIIVLKMAKVVPMREAWVKERLGKFAGVLEPGFHILLPFFDRIAYRQEMREQVIDVPAQICITRDNIQVEVDGLVYLKVMDPYRASYGISDYRLASVNLAQTTMRSEVGKLNLHESFAERDTLNVAIVREIDKASDPWGIKVLRYEIKNITPSSHVVHTLEKQMEAERERRAEVTRATAEKEATINRSEGEKQEAINLSEGQKQRRINEANGRAREIAIVAEAAAAGVRRVARALGEPGGDVALQMRIVDQYIEELAEILKTANVSVVPADLANIRGFFEGMTRVSTTLSHGTHG